MAGVPWGDVWEPELCSSSRATEIAKIHLDIFKIVLLFVSIYLYMLTFLFQPTG